MDKNIDCFDCSPIYEDTDANKKPIWKVDLLYNGKIVGIIESSDKRTIIRLRNRWYNGDR